MHLGNRWRINKIYFRDLMTTRIVAADSYEQRLRFSVQDSFKVSIIIIWSLLVPYLNVYVINEKYSWKYY